MQVSINGWDSIQLLEVITITKCAVQFEQCYDGAWPGTCSMMPCRSILSTSAWRQNSRARYKCWKLIAPDRVLMSWHYKCASPGLVENISLNCSTTVAHSAPDSVWETVPLLSRLAHGHARQTNWAEMTGMVLKHCFTWYSSVLLCLSVLCEMRRWNGGVSFSVSHHFIWPSKSIVCTFQGTHHFMLYVRREQSTKYIATFSTTSNSMSNYGWCHLIAIWLIHLRSRCNMWIASIRNSNAHYGLEQIILVHVHIGKRKDGKLCLTYECLSTHVQASLSTPQSFWMYEETPLCCHANPLRAGPRAPAVERWFLGMS